MLSLGQLALAPNELRLSLAIRDRLLEKLLINNSMLLDRISDLRSSTRFLPKIEYRELLQ